MKKTSLIILCLAIFFLIESGSSISISPVIDPNMVLYMKFDVNLTLGENETLMNSSVNNITGRLISSVNISNDGYMGKSPYFYGNKFYNWSIPGTQGLNGAIEISNDSRLYFNSSTNFTISFFIYQDNILEEQNQNDYGIFGYGFNLGFQVGSNTMKFGTRNASSGLGIINEEMKTIEWYMFTGTYNSSNRMMSLYKNGIFISNTTAPDGFTTNRLKSYLSSTVFSGDFQSFNGKIDELIIWNKTLGQLEILNMYKNYSYIGYPLLTNITLIKNDTLNTLTYSSNNLNYSLIELWLDFDEGQINFLDKSKNKNRVTSNGISAWTSEGKIGGGLFLNVTEGGEEESSIQVASNVNNSFNITDNQTISLWVYPLDYTNCYSAGGVLTKESNIYNLEVRCWEGGLYWIIYNGSYNPNYRSNIPTNEWTHYLVSSERINITSGKTRIRTYINGELTNEKNITIFGNLQNTADWKVGSRTFSAGVRAFEGKIDEIIIYRKTLNQTEISDVIQTIRPTSTHHRTNISIYTTYKDDKDLESNLNFTWRRENGTLIKSGVGQNNITQIFDYSEKLYLEVKDTDNNSINQNFSVELDATPRFSWLDFYERSYVNGKVVNINYSYTGDEIDKCWYSLNKGVTNTSLNECENITKTFTDYGKREIILYGNDSFGAIGKKVIEFINYNQTIICQSTYDFYGINISYDSCKITKRGGRTGANFKGNGYIEFNASKFLTSTSEDFYFTFWLKPKEVGGGLNNGKEGVFNKYGGIPTKGYGMYMDSSNSSKPVFYQFTDGSERNVGSSKQFINEQWYFINIIKSQNSTSLYSNGVLVGSTTTSPSIQEAENNSLFIGRSTGLYLNGTISDFKMYLGRIKNIDGEYLYKRETGIFYEQRIAILYGHTFDDEEPDPNNPLAINSTELTELMDYLNDTGYESVTHYQIYQWKIGNYTLPEKAFNINFDDSSYNDWMAIAEVMWLYNYSGNANINTNNCGTDCWANLSYMHDNYGWDIASHGATHCHFGSGTGGTVPKWCNTTEERESNFSTAYNSILTNIGQVPTAHIYPWNDNGISTEEKEAVRIQCVKYFKICYGSGTSLPSVFFANNNTNLTNGEMMRSDVGDGKVTSTSVLGLNTTKTNFEYYPKGVDISFDMLLGNNYIEDKSINRFNGTAYNITIEKEDYVQFTNDNGQTSESILTKEASNLLVIYSNNSLCGNKNIDLNDGEINCIIQPNQTITYLDNYNLTENFPRQFSPIWFAQASLNEIHIASNLTDTVTVPVIFSVQSCKNLQSVYYVSDDGTQVETFTDEAEDNCENNLVTLNLQLDSATASNVIYLTYQFDREELVDICSSIEEGFATMGAMFSVIAIVLAILISYILVFQQGKNPLVTVVSIVFAFVVSVIINVLGAIIIAYMC